MLAVLGMNEKEGQENNAVDAVRVPANLYVTKLERSCNAATHNGSNCRGIGAGRNTSSHARAPLHQALLVGVGLAILANSRPYEGLIFSLPAGIFCWLGCWGNRARR